MYIDQLEDLIKNLENILKKDKKWNNNKDNLLKKKIKRISKPRLIPIHSYFPIETNNKLNNEIEEQVNNEIVEENLLEIQGFDENNTPKIIQKNESKLEQKIVKINKPEFKPRPTEFKPRPTEFKPRPTEPNIILKPVETKETISINKPVESIVTSKPVEPIIISKPLETKETISINKPVEPIIISKPLETKETISINKPVEPIITSKPVETKETIIIPKSIEPSELKIEDNDGFFTPNPKFIKL